MECPQCHRTQPDPMRFCGQCGFRLAADEDSCQRQLTILFCDIFGAEELAGRLDPEHLRDIVREYHSTVERVIRRARGHVAQFLSDGILVYFGFPESGGDDAHRAVQASLDVQTAMAGLNDRLEQEWQLSLALRIGIHTGPVVLGEVGAGSVRDLLALGSTPNIAARLQALAEPDSLLVSEDTYELAGDGFEFRDLGRHALKGVSSPMPVYQVLGGRATARDARDRVHQDRTWELKSLLQPRQVLRSNLAPSPA